jgi:hypothetical protein
LLPISIVAEFVRYYLSNLLASASFAFATRGQAGPIPIWPHRSSRTKAKRAEMFYNIGVDSAKELIYARLAMEPSEPGFRKPGFIHFPLGACLGCPKRPDSAPAQSTTLARRAINMLARRQYRNSQPPTPDRNHRR